VRYRLLLIFWLLSDILIFIGIYALAYFLRVGWIFSSDFPFDRFIFAVVLAAPFWLLVLATTRAFALTRDQRDARNGAYIAYACLVGTALVVLTYYFTYTAFFSRLLLILAWAMSTVAIWLWHVLFDFIKRSVLRQNPPAFPVLIVGLTRESKALIEELNRKHSPLTPVAILDGHGAKELEVDGVPVRGKLNKLEEVVEEFKPTHLIQCANLEQTLNLLSLCRNRKMHYMLLPSVLGIVERDERVESLEGHPVTVVSPSGRRLSWFFR